MVHVPVQTAAAQHNYAVLSYVLKKNRLIQFMLVLYQRLILFFNKSPINVLNISFSMVKDLEPLKLRLKL